MKKTRIDSVRTVAGALHIRIALEEYAGDELVSSRWHRVAAPVADAATQVALVNEYLAEAGFPPVSLA